MTQNRFGWKLVHRREHHCGIALPTKRDRKRLGIGYGATIKVVSCGCLWEWDGAEWWRSDMAREYDLALVSTKGTAGVS
jgi:hypothetical protein